MNEGVKIVLARMESHPEEFYGENEKWRFLYKDYFRDAMTEQEKGAIFDRIKEIRREELSKRVMETVFEDHDSDEQIKEKYETSADAFRYATKGRYNV